MLALCDVRIGIEVYYVDKQDFRVLAVRPIAINMTVADIYTIVCKPADAYSVIYRGKPVTQSYLNLEERQLECIYANHEEAVLRLKEEIEAEMDLHTYCLNEIATRGGA